MTLSEGARQAIERLAEQFPLDRLGYRKTTTFDMGPDEAISGELLANRLIERFGAGRRSFILSERGLQWVMQCRQARTADRIGWWCGPGCTSRVAGVSEQDKAEHHVHTSCVVNQSSEMKWVPVTLEFRSETLVAVFPDGEATTYLLDPP